MLSEEKRLFRQAVRRQIDGFAPEYFPGTGARRGLPAALAGGYRGLKGGAIMDTQQK